MQKENGISYTKFQTKEDKSNDNSNKLKQIRCMLTNVKEIFLLLYFVNLPSRNDGARAKQLKSILQGNLR